MMFLLYTLKIILIIALGIIAIISISVFDNDNILEMIIILFLFLICVCGYASVTSAIDKKENVTCRSDITYAEENKYDIYIADGFNVHYFLSSINSEYLDYVDGTNVDDENKRITISVCYSCPKSPIEIKSEDALKQDYSLYINGIETDPLTIDLSQYKKDEISFNDEAKTIYITYH